MKKLLQSYIVDGIILVILGAVLLIYPQGTLDFLIHWVGILLIVMGAIKTLIYFVSKEERKTSYLIVSILQVICGIVMLVAPTFVKSIVPFVAGIFIAYGAIISLIKVFKVRKLHLPASKPVAFLSIATLIMALVVSIYMIKNPAEVSGLIVRLIGISTLLEGVTMLIAISLVEDKVQ